MYILIIRDQNMQVTNLDLRIYIHLHCPWNMFNITKIVHLFLTSLIFKFTVFKWKIHLYTTHKIWKKPRTFLLGVQGCIFPINPCTPMSTFMDMESKVICKAKKQRIFWTESTGIEEGDVHRSQARIIKQTLSNRERKRIIMMEIKNTS